MPGSDPMKPTPSVKFTYEDLASFAADGRRHEIIGGDHYVSPSPSTIHQGVSGNLHAALWNHLKSASGWAVFAAPFDVILSDLDVLQPDLVYISRERAQVLTELHVRGAPDLVVEILSSACERPTKLPSARSTSGTASRNTGVWIRN
jgi:Uma2 family endonuclease